MNNDLFNIIERLANLLRSEARALGQPLGLQPVQHDALYYLSICNQYSDTPIAVTEFLGLTKGTVSQTLKVLENKNLIFKAKDREDKRVTHLKLTTNGQRYIEQAVPPTAFTQALASLETETHASLTEQLKRLLHYYQQINGRKGFGVCRHCRHNQSKDGQFFCGLTKELLSNDEIQLICREFEEGI